ncbi:hypothetical protein M9458_022073, partial [Cirrhinus mrigala]
MATRTSAWIQLPALALSVHGQTHGFALRELLEESQPWCAPNQRGELRSVDG